MEDEEDYASSDSSGISLDGRNVGAAMVAPRDVNLAASGGCRINIYVNSNVQGACTSAVLGSKIKLRDPGVHLYVGDVKISGDGDGNGNGNECRRQEMRWIKVGLCLLSLFNIVIAMVLLLSSRSR